MAGAEPGLLFLGAFALAACLTPAVREWLLRRRLVDLPDGRRSHDRPTPRGGGLAVVTTLIVCWLAWPGALRDWWLAMAVLVALAGVGWFEDRHGLAARWRFLAQLLVATGLVAAVGGIDLIHVFGRPVEAPLALSGLAVLGAVWLINLHNFMDGSDGLAAMQGVWLGTVFAALFALAAEAQLAALALAVAGAWCGFLCWNRPPASVFMGDSGSLGLGSLAAAFVILGLTTGAASVSIGFMAVSVFAVDATLTLLRRLVRGERWYTPHRQHAYQRLLIMGWSHGRVLALYALVNLLLVLPVIAVAWRWPLFDTWLASGLAALLAAGWQVVQSASTRHNDKASL